mmetsp:Transcript_4084/g.7867  ORF Transcript_4084/g.7867 Transcript_4084/m.7867 type:complete len:278 (-) Transcript_4084:568-1401(-)
MLPSPFLCLFGPLFFLRQTEKKAGIPHFNPRSSTKMTKSFVLRPRAISSMERSKNFTFMMPSNITASSSHCPMPSQHHPSQLDTRRNYGLPNMPVVVEQSPSYRQAYASKRPPPAADDSPVINDCCTSPTTPVGNARHVMTYDQHFPISPPYFSSPVSTNPINFKRGEPNARTVLHRKFSWKNYPELEAFLVANRKEYLHHSQLNYTATQKQYNNRLTERLIKLAEESGYEFDPTEFNFVAIRDRIRCYFKSYVQSNKKKGIIVGYKAAKAQLEQDM